MFGASTVILKMYHHTLNKCRSEIEKKFEVLFATFLRIENVKNHYLYVLLYYNIISNVNFNVTPCNKIQVVKYITGNKQQEKFNAFWLDVGINHQVLHHIP